MKIILIWYTGTVDEVIVANDHEVDGFVERINEANSKLDPDKRIDRVVVKVPSDIDEVIDYIKNPW